MSVIEADSAPAAFAVMERGDPIDAVVSDINMPLTEHARRYLLAEGLRPETVIKIGSTCS